MKMTKSEQNKETDILRNENKRLKQNITEMLYALNQAKAALELHGGKKKPTTDFIPSEVLAYRTVVDAINNFKY